MPDGYGTKQQVSSATAHARAKRAAIAKGTWNPFVNAVSATIRVRRLHAWGMSVEAMASAWTVGGSTVDRLLRGQHPEIRPLTERRILTGSLDPRCMPPGVLVPATGTQRRLRALSCMQWSYRDVSRQAGVGHKAVATVMMRRRVNAGLAAAIADAYDELWDQLGPHAQCARLSQRHGALGPLHWDDATIDDPTQGPWRDAKAPCDPE